jgi:hypothetical protein
MGDPHVYLAQLGDDVLGARHDVPFRRRTRDSAQREITCGRLGRVLKAAE